MAIAMHAHGVPGAEIGRNRWQRAQQRFLECEPGKRLLARGAVDAHTRFLEHPAARLRVQVDEITELAQGQEVALDVLDAGFDDTFLSRVSRRARIDLEPVTLGAFGIGALHQRVVHARLGNRALGVVDDEPRGNRSEPFEGPAMTAEPGGDRLIPDELDVLMAREAQRHHEAPGTPQLATRGIEQEGSGAEVDLRCLAGRELQAYGGLRWPCCVERLQHPPHRRVAAAVAVLATQRRMDRHAGHALLDPPCDESAEWFDGRHGAARALRPTDHGRDVAVRRQRRVGNEPAVPLGKCAQGGHLRPPHQASARDVAIGIALAQAHQNRSILEHLDSPSRHRLSPQKIRERSGSARQFEMSVIPSTGSNMPISDWLHYGDHQVAPICRSRRGFYVPIPK